MSQGSISNPRIWLNADVYTAPVGTTAPTNVTSTWTSVSPLWLPLGLLSQDDGMTETRDQDVTDHYAWGNILVRTTKAKIKFSFQVTALEDTPTVFDLIYPGSVDVTTLGVTTRTVKVPTTNPRAFGFEFVDGTVIKRRIIPTGEIVDISDISINDSDMAGYQFTINAYPSAAGVVWTDISNDSQWAVAS